MSEHGILSRVLNEPSLRVMVFCAAEGHGQQDIAFPHQSEIKVNGGEVKANLRGLKNRPGSTRPVDITKELRLKTSNNTYTNTVEMTYALTNKVGESQVSFQTHPKSHCIAFPVALPISRRSDQARDADSQQKFYLVIWVVKVVPVADLVKKIEVGRRITRESVINESKFPLPLVMAIIWF
jgi:E3 SUMO-protein ligase PIAS1